MKLQGRSTAFHNMNPTDKIPVEFTSTGLVAYRIRGCGGIDHFRIRLIWRASTPCVLFVCSTPAPQLFSDILPGREIDLDVPRSAGRLLGVTISEGLQEVWCWKFSRSRSADAVVISGAGKHRGNITIESESSDIPLSVHIKDAGDVYGDIKVVARNSKEKPEFIPHSWHSVVSGNTAKLTGNPSIRRLILVSGDYLPLGRGSSSVNMWDICLQTPSGLTVALDEYGRLVNPKDAMREGRTVYFPLSRVHATMRWNDVNDYIDVTDGHEGNPSKRGVFVNDVLVDKGWQSLKAPCSFSLGPSGYPHHAAIHVEPYRLEAGGCVLGLQLKNHSSFDFVVWAQKGSEIGVLPLPQHLLPVMEGSKCSLKFRHEQNHWKCFVDDNLIPVYHDKRVPVANQEIRLKNFDGPIAFVELS